MSQPQLSYLLNLKDNLSPNVKKAAQSFETLKAKGQAAIADIGFAFGGLMAAGAGIKSLVAPALEMDRAIGNAGLLGVGAEGMERLRKASNDLAMTIGGDALAIANTGIEVKRALNDIDDLELGQANAALHGLSGALNGNVNDAISYAAQMRAIFKKQADEQGVGAFIEDLVGKTEKAAEIFKGSLSDYSGALSSLGATATNLGASQAEQLALIGLVSKQAGGGAAGGAQLKQLYDNIGKAQKELGLKFTDQNGQLLSMGEIADKIKGKFKNGINAEQFTAAFGKKGAQAMLEILKQSDKLKTSIDEINQATGSETAIQKTADASDGFLRFSASVAALKDTIGAAVLPPLYEIAEAAAKGIRVFQGWISQHQWLAKLIGFTAVALIGFGAVIPVLMGIKGIFTLIATGLGAAKIAGLGFAGFLKVATLAAWKFTAALLANPMTWLVVGIAAVVAGLALLIKHWDTVKAVALATLDSVGAFFNEKVTAMGQWFGEVFGGIGEKISETFATVWETVRSSAEAAWTAVSEFVLGTFARVTESIRGFFMKVWEDLKISAVNGLNAVIETANRLLSKIGLDIPLIEIPVTTKAIETATGAPQAAGFHANFADSIANATAISSAEALQPKKFEKGAGAKGLTQNNQTTVTNHITVNAKTDAKPQDIARAIAEEKQLAG